MSEPLRDLMGELAGEQPAVADWPGRVRGLVVRRRRRQRVLTAAAAAALLAVGGTGVLLAAEQPRPDSLVAAPDPSPSPTVSAGAPTPEPEPSAATPPSPTGQPEPTAEATASAAPPPPPLTSPAAPPPPPLTSPAPTYPPFGTQDIEITTRARPERPAVGEEWVLDITVTGFAESPPYLQEPCIDGPGRCQYAAFSCVPRQSSSPPPARAQRIERSVRHTFTTAGRHEVRLLAEGACSYYQGRDELLVVVEVVEPEPEPEPEPSPEPSPAASP